MTQRQIHNLELAEVWSYLRSRADGLGPDEVAQRLAELGPNTLDPPPRWGWLRILAAQVTNLFSVLLYVSAALCFVADHMQPGEGMTVLGWALTGVAVLNAAFTFAQTIRAEHAMRALRDLLPQVVTVRRAGVEAALPIAALVPGDVLALDVGAELGFLNEPLAGARWCAARARRWSTPPAAAPSSARSRRCRSRSGGRRRRSSARSRAWSASSPRSRW